MCKSFFLSLSAAAVNFDGDDAFGDLPDDDAFGDLDFGGLEDEDEDEKGGASGF